MENEQAQPRLGDLVTILYQPRQTIRRILDHAHDRWAVQIVLLAFVCASVNDSDIHRLGDVLPGLSLISQIALVTVALAVVAMLWVLGLFLLAWIVTLVGHVLGGLGSVADVRAALAWGMVPVIWSVIYRIPLAMFKSRFHVGPHADPKTVLLDVIAHGGCAVAVIVLVLQLVMIVWCLFIGSSALGEAQRFSSWKGLANLALAIGLPVILLCGAVFTLMR